MAGGGANLAGVNANAEKSGTMPNGLGSSWNDTTMTYPGSQPSTFPTQTASATQQSPTQVYQYGPFSQQTNPYAQQGAMTGYAQSTPNQQSQTTSQYPFNQYAPQAQTQSNPYSYNPYAPQQQGGYSPFTPPQNFQIPQGLQDQLQSLFSSFQRSNYDPTKASSLSAQQQQYTQANDTAIKQQRADQIAKAKEAQDAYNKAQADKKAAAEAAAAAAASEAERDGWNALFGSSAARGGDVGIAGLRRRK